MGGTLHEMYNSFYLENKYWDGWGDKQVIFPFCKPSPAHFYSYPECTHTLYANIYYIKTNENDV